MNLTEKILVFFSLSLLLAACAVNGASITTPSSEVHPATLETATATEESTVFQIYKSNRFSIEYPNELAFYENERPSVDGVMAPLQNSITLQASGFLLTVTTFDIAPGTTLANFIDGHLECLEVNSTGGQSATLGSLDAKLFPDTLCGLNGITYLYAVQGGTGYRLTIESGDDFAFVLSAVQPILDSFQVVETPLSTAEIVHNGNQPKL